MFLFALFASLLNVSAQLATPVLKTPVHDPVMIKEGDTYYIFSTGNGISVSASKDMKHWKKSQPVFSKPPVWATRAVPGFKGHIWAPDISYQNGLYLLYYSVSTFGKNTSCIGVAVNKTLNETSPDYGWVDKGMVLQSVANRDRWNAIDPNLALDGDGTPWLAFGSFWNGIKLVKLNPDCITLADPPVWYSLANRNRDTGLADSLAGNGAIEAPFIFRRNNFYYLFVSVDFCCRGAKSDYKMVVGRSSNISGPYVDKNGIDLMLGGGTPVRKGNPFWYGAGHNSTYTIEGKDYLVYHGYDASDKGRSKLIIEILDWTPDNWPVEKSLPDQSSF